MKNTVENNLRTWDQRYDWSKDGDEWDGQARLCNQPYEAWKRSLIDTFILPNIAKDVVALEIAPGHGRWSREMVGRCKELILVDLSPSCIEFCRKLFASHSHVQYIANDGKSLPGVKDGSVDFLWSYDSFVHMDPDTIAAYLSEARRVLKPGGKAIIHHAGRRHEWLWLGFLMRGGKTGRNVYKVFSQASLSDFDGWRSNVSQELFAKLAEDRGLAVQSQLRSWGANHEFGIPRFRDSMTILKKT